VAAGDEVGARLTAGDVLLAHDGGRVVGANAQDIDRSGTLAALPALLERVRARGLVGVPVQDLVAAGTPH
jgi:hypothetical protein